MIVQMKKISLIVSDNDRGSVVAVVGVGVRTIQPPGT